MPDDHWSDWTQIEAAQAQADREQDRPPDRVQRPLRLVKPIPAVERA